ncbi:plastocyanin [Cytobacillus eiseniae]|uniref:Plastocyanin n=1 Tax=Cytobacillus eiseniae TaxID=762947 RepID=A0ABS4RA33_9BACI|nr:cupredoxin domain-containing protein [Cytobacillus eiseniae]MBP2239755.1 plastocyanin [Cytobacillus eiseniae]
MPFFVLKKRSVILFLVLILGMASASVWLFMNKEAESVFSQETNGEVREIHMVTGEFKATRADGKEIESYRWDPGTIFVEKGEKVNLMISGVNGAEHPFSIEGTDIKGVVKKGEETVVPLQFKKDGVYRLICHTHHDKDQNGPMIAYIVVD